MFYEVWFLSSTIELFFLFQCLMNNVWFVWTACKTLLDSRTHTRPSLILIWAYSVPESLSTMFCNICFTLLDLFGHPVEHHPTLFYDVLLVWTGLKETWQFVWINWSSLSNHLYFLEVWWIKYMMYENMELSESVHTTFQNELCRAEKRWSVQTKRIAYTVHCFLI